ncbi:hypothetical protein MNBD_PLANCTO02-3231 [hydrothermal vent metagenome]|uniref:Uncharacterized protein n=1 Tax=hydrothermal vent metagenome TaxID=652676 RepID=A0A3B1DTL8_9ZZZZ
MAISSRHNDYSFLYSRLMLGFIFPAWSFLSPLNELLSYLSVYISSYLFVMCSELSSRFIALRIINTL